MYNLGISCYYHDSAAALLKDGHVVAAVEEERFSRKKFHMFPIIILLIALIGVTALAQSGLVAFIYPI